jgi:hypothetical protein
VIFRLRAEASVGVCDLVAFALRRKNQAATVSVRSSPGSSRSLSTTEIQYVFDPIAARTTTSGSSPTIDKAMMPSGIAERVATNEMRRRRARGTSRGRSRSWVRVAWRARARRTPKAGSATRLDCGRVQQAAQPNAEKYRGPATHFLHGESLSLLTAPRTAELWRVREVPCPAAIWPRSDQVICWQLEQIGPRFRAADVAQLIADDTDDRIF